MPKWFVGIDGGATKTACWVADEAGLRGAGRSGPAAWRIKGLADHVEEALTEALKSAGARGGDDAVAVLGLSGADFPEDFVELTDAVRPVMQGMPFRVVNDTEVALVGGSARGWGVVSICGSGTNCLGRYPDGRTFTIGGMGYDGDYGGGGELAAAAVAHAFRADQGRGPATVLRDWVLDVVKLPDYAALSRGIHLERPIGPAERQSLSRLVFRAAAAGDGVAQDMLVRMGEALGATAGAAAARLTPPGADLVEVVQAGSVWLGPHPLMRDAFQLAVHRYTTAVDIHLALSEPVAGAVLLAAGDAGVPLERLREGLPTWEEEAMG